MGRAVDRGNAGRASHVTAAVILTAPAGGIGERAKCPALSVNACSCAGLACSEGGPLMNRHHRNLLALALLTALASPTAWAQGKGPQKGASPTTGVTVSDAVRSEGPTRDDADASADQTVAQTARETDATPQQT